MKLDPSESFNNMGKLRVEIIDGANLPAADRNNSSDPYLKFYLGGKDIYKTAIQKKTLNPTYNESFETAIRSRTAAVFEIHAFDWDFGDSDDFLGKGKIDLTALEPFQRKEVQIPLDGKSGTIRLRMLFTPDYITRSRQGSSTFQGGFGTATKVAGAPVKTVGKGAAVVGGGVAKAGTFLGKSFRRRKSRAGSEFDADDASSFNDGDAPPVPAVPVINSIEPSTPSHSRAKSLGAQSIAGSPGGLSPGSGEQGTASISVLSTTGFPPASNVRVHIKSEVPGKGSKEVHKTKAVKASSGEVSFGESEGFKTSCSADTSFRIIVKDHSTFGHDDDLGEGTFFLADQGNGSIGKEQVVNMSKGDGKVLLRTRFEPLEKGSTISSAPNKLNRVFGSSKRDSRERSATPGA
jgi:Ca2+-dependent lipid-binding protein